MIIRYMTQSDFERWHQMRVALWPDELLPEDKSDLQEYITSDTMTAFVAQNESGALVGFLEANIRSHAEDCATRNVGFIEGWYVEEKYRRQGIGGALVKAAENWARSKGCREIASNCLLDNALSLQAHLALGYQETSRLINFVKPL